MHNDLNLDNIKHIAQLAFSREKEILSDEALVEFLMLEQSLKKRTPVTSE